MVWLLLPEGHATEQSCLMSQHLNETGDSPARSEEYGSNVKMSLLFDGKRKKGSDSTTAPLRPSVANFFLHSYCLQDVDNKTKTTHKEDTQTGQRVHIVLRPDPAVSACLLSGALSVQVSSGSAQCGVGSWPKPPGLDVRPTA